MQIRDRVKELRRVRAGDLRPNPRNWRTHPKHQQDALKGVLAEVGYADALIARALEDGGLELIDGHLRAETTPDLLVPVLVLDVNEDEAAKLLATIDPLAALAEADPAKLKALLESVKTDNAALAEMLSDLGHLYQGPPVAGLMDPDQVPAMPGEPVSRRGDVWVLGNHRLMCGDSSSPQDLDRLLAGAAVHLVNTDPPYNVKVEPRSNNAIAAGLSSFQIAPLAGDSPDPANIHQQKADVGRSPGKSRATHKQLRAKDRPLANDFVSDEAFDVLLTAWFGNIARVLVPGGGFYIWGGYANCGNYPPVLKACKLYFSQAIIWDKQHPVLTRKDFMGAHEWCFYGWREGGPHHFYGPANIPDLWAIKKVNPQAMVHLTEKPVELAARAISYSSKPGENVLDLFGGSGSTLIACEQSGRRGHLMELDGLYCDVIVRRWEAFTGKAAVLEQSSASTGMAAGDESSAGNKGRKKARSGMRSFTEVAAERGVSLTPVATTDPAPTEPIPPKEN